MTTTGPSAHITNDHSAPNTAPAPSKSGVHHRLLHDHLAPEAEPATSKLQRWAAITSRVLSVVLFILLLVWLVGEAGGLEWYPGDSFFNLHPFFMLMGVGVFMTNSVVSWRDFSFSMKHQVVKLIHLFLNLCAMLFIGLGLYVTFKANSAPAFVTFHSWMALIALAFLGLQFVGGLFAYALPTLSLNMREWMLPKHAGMGMATYFLLCTVCLLGIVEFLGLTTVNAPLLSAVTSPTNVNAENRPGSALNNYFTTNAVRDQYRNAAPMLGNVTAVCLLAIMLAVGYSLVPRRNVAVDKERGPLHHHVDADGVHRAKNGSAAADATNTNQTVPPQQAGVPLSQV